MGSLSFDPLVEYCDRTRIFDSDCFGQALDHLAGEFPPGRYPRLLEPGIGTGRIALPFSRLGYSVCGVDISSGMLRALKQRLPFKEGQRRIHAQQADATQLPYRNAAFDLAVAVHFFPFLSEWRIAADEILRVVRPEGAIILLHTGTGAEIPAMNESYRAACRDQGHSPSLQNAASTRDVVAHLEARGCSALWRKDQWGWMTRIVPGNALEYVRRRAYSFTVGVPDSIHREAVRRVEAEYRPALAYPRMVICVPNQIYYVALSVPAKTRR